MSKGREKLSVIASSQKSGSPAMDDVASLQTDLQELVGGKHAEREGCTMRLDPMANQNMESEINFCQHWIFVVV
jgi:hypothetical protein